MTETTDEAMRDLCPRYLARDPFGPDVLDVRVRVGARQPLDGWEVTYTLAVQGPTVTLTVDSNDTLATFYHSWATDGAGRALESWRVSPQDYEGDAARWFAAAEQTADEAISRLHPGPRPWAS